MKRRTFFKTTAAVSLAAGIGLDKASAFVPAHNWEKYDFGSGPDVKDRLYQGPFPRYDPEPVVAGSSVVMSTMPSDKVLHNYGMGLTTYVVDEHGLPGFSGNRLKKHVYDLIDLELGQKLYIRVTGEIFKRNPEDWVLLSSGRLHLSVRPRKTSVSVSASSWPAR